MTTTPKGKNHLSLVRKKRGLGQKQIAVLLGHQTSNQISRYERGVKLPSFETALKLGIIYQLPAHVLFYGFYENCLNKLENNKESMSGKEDSIRQAVGRSDFDKEFCTFTEKLKPIRVPESDLNKARHHIADLINARTKKMNYSLPLQ